MRFTRLGRSTASVATAAAIAVASAGSARVGRADAPTGRYMVGNGVVYDKSTGLKWQQIAAPSKYVALSGGGFPDATSYCTTLNLNGTGWRLPSVGELETLIDETLYAPSIDRTAFPNMPTDDLLFWTQSTYSLSTDFFWAVSFDYGLAEVQSQSQSHYVRCVLPPP